MNLSQYLHHWLENKAEPNVRPRTFNDYKEIVTRHLIPNLCNIQLEQFQPTHLETYYSRALEQGRLDGKGGLWAQTVQHHHRMLSGVLNHAVNMQVLGRNAA